MRDENSFKMHLMPSTDEGLIKNVDMKGNAMKTITKNSKWILAPTIAVAALVVCGCSKQAAEDAGGAVKDAAKDAEQGVADAASATGDAVKEAGHAAADTAKEAAQTAGDAAIKAVESAGDAAKDVEDKVSAGFSAAAEKASAALESVEGGGKLLTGIKDFFSSAEESLKGITDKASAEAALPKFDELASSLDGLAESAAKLPEEAMSAVKSVFEKGVAEIKSLAEKVFDIEGVEEVVKPKLDELMDKLKSLTGNESDS